MKISLKKTILATACFTLILGLQACGKYNFSSNDSVVVQNANCTTDSFVQNQPTTSSADILFVAHATGSFDSVKQNVVNGLNSLVSQLPNGSDYQIAVMAADSPRDSASGTLYSDSRNSSVVLKSSMGVSAIQQALTYDFSTLPQSGINAEGTSEEGIAAVYTGLGTAKLANTRSTYNFFRNNAALAVVFMANEADMCGLSVIGHDPMTDTDYSSSVSTFTTDCINNGITPDSLYQRILAVQGVNPSLVGSVVYTDPTITPAKAGVSTEAEFGWGYFDVAKDAGGPEVDLLGGASGIANGLASIGQLLKTKLTLKTDFTLTENNVDPASITVTIDGTKTTNFTYSAGSDQVHVANPGQAGSNIDIYYCQLPH